MGVRENKVEKYLKDEVAKLGGISRKWVSPGHDGVPDQIVIYKSHVFFIEVKTPDGSLSSVQIREQKRLKYHGASVLVVYGNHDVDDVITNLKINCGLFI